MSPSWDIQQYLFIQPNITGTGAGNGTDIDSDTDIDTDNDTDHMITRTIEQKNFEICSKWYRILKEIFSTLVFLNIA